jgi:hypothetical protein
VKALSVIPTPHQVWNKLLPEPGLFNFTALELKFIPMEIGAGVKNSL